MACIVAYDSHLSLLHKYLQQAEMESNGHLWLEKNWMAIPLIGLSLKFGVQLGKKLAMEIYENKGEMDESTKNLLKEINY
ncbi:unnamed protein product [Medioppia subpectinata]|uniref:Uncharacterized protein n=1 Tax=Medioppia subpectinata TaxID=1979941 RepID=A0A7R9PV59_9ACAR|nr:unnamed protein product [Medioppia subpectinata]CAG2102259.1 unnamed protein product [Medioppia subpectinata]